MVLLPYSRVDEPIYSEPVYSVGAIELNDGPNLTEVQIENVTRFSTYQTPPESRRNSALVPLVQVTEL